MLSVPIVIEEMMRGITLLNTDGNRLLVPFANPSAQIVVPHSLTQIVLALNHYTVLEGDPKGRKNYTIVKQQF